MKDAQTVIAALGLQAHPEGGWYKETWRAPAADGERASSTLIYFLLESGQSSHWHRVDADEIWLWHGGNPLEISISKSQQQEIDRMRLGPDVTGGEMAQAVVPAGDWQAATPLEGEYDYALVSCVVAPGFEFSGFTLAPEGWHPQHA